MEDIDDQEEVLNLSLALVSDSGRDRVVQGKRKRKDHNHHIVPFLNHKIISEGFEGKIFRLLQMREQMLKRKGGIEDAKGLHLIHLLLITATAVDETNVTFAVENLSELYQTVCLAGDSIQRVVAYFADGLAARLLTRKSPFYDMLMKEPTPVEKFLAFTDLYRVSPYYQFAHFTANQAIIEAFEAEEDSNNRALHVIDFDISYGFQWPSLIQSAAEKATSSNRISLRITGFGRSLEELQETENRLVSFAKSLRNVVFEFHGMLRGDKVLNLRKKKNETVAVNLVFHLNRLKNIMKISDTLRSVHSLSPSIVVLVEQEGSRSPRSFISRFMESLHYFAAMFDSLDDCLPLESAERLSIEKNHLGKEIKNMLNYDDHVSNESFSTNVDDHARCPNYEKLETWKGRMDSHGFEGTKLSSKCMIQAKLLLKIRTHSCPCPVEFGGEGGFRVFERDDGRAISLGWQDRCLITASAWRSV